MCMDKTMQELKESIVNCSSNQHFTNQDWQPIFYASVSSKIILISQAPSFRAQLSGIAWQDFSGNTLRSWLGVNKDDFYDASKFSVLPMDFYFPGKAVRGSGDKLPRLEFAAHWHPKFFASFEEVKLIVLIGRFAQKYYLGSSAQKNLTLTVQNYEIYLPKFFVLPHPSPLNGRWLKNNPWFEIEVLPKLQLVVKNILDV